MSKLEEAHAKDLTVSCPDQNCNSKIGEECQGLSIGIVHISRRRRWKYPQTEQQMSDRPSFEHIYMRLAFMMAERSTCKRTMSDGSSANVGCVITSTDFRYVYGVGYNGSAAGGPNDCDKMEQKLLDHADVYTQSATRLLIVEQNGHMERLCL